MSYKSSTQFRLESETPYIPFKGGVRVDATRNSYETIEYPINELGGDRYPHYVMFYINENSKALLSDEKTVAVDRSKLTAGSGFSKTVNTMTGDMLSGATELSQKLQSGPDSWVDPKVKEGLDGMSGATKTFKSSTKRLKTSICLPMPQKVMTNYGANYTKTDPVGGLGAVIASAVNGGGDSGSTALMAIAPAAGSMATEMAKSIGAKVLGATGIDGGTVMEGVVGKGMSQENMSKLLTKVSGMVINSRQEQLFTNMEFRQHKFSYLFIPRTEEESVNIKKIISLFKTHMHPTLHGGNSDASLLVVPAEFDIEFRFKDQQNSNIHKIASCCLQSMDVDYTAIGEFMAFKDTDNPVAIQMTLTFTELEPLNRDMIKRGY